ncbi:MAG TPA: hypothetical protein VNW06_04065 [Cytophagaceae bacterium]|jgi:hypothetical protein|nr:hypothetical protein [Cytophagaceae bacterium]
MNGRAGEYCQQSGIYKCQNHPRKTVPLSMGEKFPVCCLEEVQSTVWVLVVKVCGNSKASKEVLS